MSNISKIIDPSNPFPLMEMFPSFVLLFDPRNVLLYYIPHFVLTVVLLSVQILYAEPLIELRFSPLLVHHLYLLQMVSNLSLVTHSLITAQVVALRTVFETVPK